MVTVLRSLLVAALIAGGVSGVLLGMAQVALVTPFILEAEAQEGRDASGHVPAQTVWQPKDGFERNAYTVLFAALTGIGYALLLNAGMLIRGRSGMKQGLLWGCAGFVIFSLSPALGLPPEPPGGHATDLLERQIWWLGTVVATALGLSCIAFSQRTLLRVSGLAALVLPHLIGPPGRELLGESSVLHLEPVYAIASLLAMFVFWAILGVLSGCLHSKLLAGNKGEISFARPA